MILQENFYVTSCHGVSQGWLHALAVARDEGLEATALTSSPGALHSTSALALFPLIDLEVPTLLANLVGRKTLNALPTAVSATADTLVASEAALQVVYRQSNRLHSFQLPLIYWGLLAC